ncbi:glycoside hydrolase family 88/105 protein [Anaerosporobacter faecicola]|uniref:glycoside hydrolase family 88/105 protein n=1 Tax=Anaerosporobacter faecicola TaxID=2718714 RepID=UPI001439D1F8|nr:glycoside hydrolase family 88 protein [Anaerosporobacter faecicola]
MIVTQYLKTYLSNYQNYKEYWNYEDGCVLMGCKEMYDTTGDLFYKEFIQTYVDSFVNLEGTISRYKRESYSLDSINAGKILFFLYKQTKEDKYYKAIEYSMDQLRKQPRTNCGNFWHKKIYPNQIWLDGLYMALPFYMAYETVFNKKENYNDIINQFMNVRKYIFDDKKQLYYHGYDETKTMPWADPITGVSKSFWLRAMGWYLMALIDTMDVMSIEIFEAYKTLEGLFKEAVKGILQYQDKNNKMFYQVIDRSDVKENYTETSGTSMIAYAIFKGCRLGVLSEERYKKRAEEILASVIEQKLVEKDGTKVLTDICHAAGLGPSTERDGSILYYLSEEVAVDDPKGVGPFMMAYAQSLMTK